MVKTFNFALSQLVRLSRSQEEGEIIARVEYLTSEAQYYVRYMAGDGCQRENWWAESAICAVG